MEKKQVIVIIPGAGPNSERSVILSPGDTVRHIKAQVPELNDLAIFKSWDSLPLKEKEDLYEKLRQGSKLFAASYQDVG